MPTCQILSNLINRTNPWAAAVNMILYTYSHPNILSPALRYEGFIQNTDIQKTSSNIHTYNATLSKREKKINVSTKSRSIQTLQTTEDIVVFVVGKRDCLFHVLWLRLGPFNSAILYLIKWLNVCWIFVQLRAFFSICFVLHLVNSYRSMQKVLYVIS